MEQLGTAILSFAAIFAGVAVLFAVTARERPGRLRAAHLALHAVSLLLVAAVAALAYAFLAHDFSLRYVADYSDRATRLVWLLAGTWAGQNGSLLLWAAAVSAACSVFLAWRHRAGGAAPGDGALAAGAALVVLALIFLVVIYASPFQPVLRSHPVDGTGLNGLLRNPLMAIHPPVLFAAYALTVVPALLAAAALLRGDTDAGWLREARPYALLAWGLLGLGNLLGMLWAYEELGWGGYWGWDPVENASLLPWLASTAFVHVAAVAERRGMLRRTAALLAFLTLLLPLFGTYLTRSGVVASQHAFAESPASGAFLVLLSALAALGVALVAWRWTKLGAGAAHVESIASREAGAVFTAVLLVVMLLALAAATMAPLLGKLFGDDAVQIQPAGYVRFMGPLALVLLFLTAVCPLLAYRSTPGRRFWSVVALPGAAAVVKLVALLAFGEALGFGPHAGGRLHWFALVAFPLAAFVVVAALADVVRGIRARARAAGEPLLAAARWFVVAGRRRSGSDLVHLGAALMFAGFAGASYQQDGQAMLRPAAAAGTAAASLAVGDWRLTYLGDHDAAEPEYDETQALLRVDAPDGTSSLATPSLRTYRSGSVRDTAEVAILTGFVEDFYIEVRQFMGAAPGARTAFIRAHVNPLTSLVWGGSLLLFCGTIVALWPARRGGRRAEWGAALRRARSFALLAAVFVAGVAALRDAASGALVAAGAALIAALWAGGLAVAAAVERDREADAGAAGPTEAGADADGLEVEKLMGRWSDEP